MKASAGAHLSPLSTSRPERRVEGFAADPEDIGSLRWARSAYNRPEVAAACVTALEEGREVKRLFRRRSVKRVTVAGVLMFLAFASHLFLSQDVHDHDDLRGVLQIYAAIVDQVAAGCTTGMPFESLGEIEPGMRAHLEQAGWHLDAISVADDTVEISVSTQDLIGTSFSVRSPRQPCGD